MGVDARQLDFYLDSPCKNCKRLGGTDEPCEECIVVAVVSVKDEK
jgi:hypothetical protein